MPVRRINFTGRRRLRAEDVDIVVDESATPPQFKIARLTLESYGLPSNSLVCVESYRQTSYMRFPVGTVEKLHIHDPFTLTEFDSPEGIKFRVKVTSASGDTSGQLLAELSGVSDQRRESLLAVRPDPDIDHEVFQIDFTDEPILLINEKLDRWKEAVTEPTFVSLVFPATFREILTRILHIDKHTDVDDRDDWRSRWLRLAEGLAGQAPPVEADDTDAFDDWIECAVAAFCKDNRIYDLFAKGFYDGSSA